MSKISLSALYLYPIKSLGGISLTHWPVDNLGLKYDRRWMLIDENRQFLSQRRLPRMALIKTEIHENELIISAPGRELLRLDLEPEQGNTITSSIWQDEVDTTTVSNKADEWFRAFLGVNCRLVHQPESAIRHVNPKYATPNDITSLSDGFPFMLISESSLSALNKAMNLELSMQRFRPNLVVSGCDAFAEDAWREISVGSIGFRLPKPCSRCSVPTIDPDTAETGKEPLTTLNRLRKWENKVYFGQNALHDNGGLLSIGDKVVVKTTGANQPPL